jgi:hypothetical protein
MWSEDAWRLAMSTTRNEEWPVPAPWGQEPWRAARIAKRELPSRLTYYRGHNTKAPRGGDTKSVRTSYRRDFWIVRAANDPDVRMRGQWNPSGDHRRAGDAGAARGTVWHGILSGRNSAEGTIFRIFSLIVTKMLDPIFAPIRFDFDLPGRRAKISIHGDTRDRKRADPQSGDRRAASYPDRDAGRVRAPQRRGMQFADREHRRDQVQRAAKARLTRHGGADA